MYTQQATRVEYVHPADYPGGICPYLTVPGWYMPVSDSTRVGVLPPYHATRVGVLPPYHATRVGMRGIHPWVYGQGIHSWVYQHAPMVRPTVCTSPTRPSMATRRTVGL